MLIIHDSIRIKLKEKHNVTESEVIECFTNLTGDYEEDEREDHKTNPPSYFFHAPTDTGRVLRVVFMIVEDDVVLKTAFEP